MPQERAMRAVTRRHNLDGLKPYLEYARMATETVSFVSVQNGIHDRYTIHNMLYHRLRSPYVSSVITQGCIAVGTAAAKNIDDPERSPTIRNPVLVINNQMWKLNPVGEAYVAWCNIGTREHPHAIAIPVSKKVGDMVSACKKGDLRIGHDSYTITYSKEVPPPQKTERKFTSISELVSGIDYLGGEPKRIMAADMNAWGVMVGDGETITKFDVSCAVQDVVDAKQHNTKHNVQRTQRRYERRHKRPISNRKVEAKREKRILVSGGERKIFKDGRDIARLERVQQTEIKKVDSERRATMKTVETKEEKHIVKKEFAAQKKAVKKQYDTTIGKLKGMRNGRRRTVQNIQKTDNEAKRHHISQVTKTLDHTLHAASIVIVMMALRNNAVLVLEDLTHISDGWGKHGKFGKSLRRKLYSAAMLKLQQYIRHKAAWEGVETLNIIPRNTSALCCVCRHTLYGNYTYRTCPNCIVRVDRDVNAVWNVWRTTAAARYGLKVRPSREEAQRTPDVILCPGVLVRGGRSLRVDREFDTGGV